MHFMLLFPPAYGAGCFLQNIVAAVPPPAYKFTTCLLVCELMGRLLMVVCEEYETFVLKN